MEVLFSFIGGLIVAAVVSVVVVRRILASRVEQAQQAAKLEAESLYMVENARLQSDLKHSQERIKELQDRTREQLTAAKEEAAQAQKTAMDMLQDRFNETISKVTAQVKAETGEMLKARQ